MAWSLFLLVALAGYLLYNLLDALISLRRNVAAAKASGFPYRVVPLFFLSRTWILISMPILGLARRVPQRWHPYWLEYLSPMQSWTNRYSTYKEIGCDMFMTVSPGGNVLFVADADAMAQITQRRNDFTKPVHFYKSIDIYGDNVVTAEGNAWRHHRRVVAPPFNEKNNLLVWDESLRQATSMMRSWTGPKGECDASVTDVAESAMRLSLYVISKAGFGRSMEWESEASHSNENATLAAEESDLETPLMKDGTRHTMTYSGALKSLLRHTLVLVAVPKTLRRLLPIKILKRADLSYKEWGSYMDEIYEEKREQLRAGTHDERDLMSGLIAAAGDDEKTHGGPRPLMSREEIMGNSFVVILAGHETTANTLHFSLVYMALNMTAQRRTQAELDVIFGDRPVSQWKYDEDMPRLFGGMLGACMAEELRLVPPVADIPKWVTSPQPLTVGSKRYIVPAYTQISLCTVAVQRNPRFWPHGQPRNPADPEHPRSNRDNDLEEFKPERWLPADYQGPSALQDGAMSGFKGMSSAGQGDRSPEADEVGLNLAADTAATLLKPPKGSFMPFSEGHRSCLGRRFAQVEFLAVMAVILKTWSVELAVDEWASDAEVAQMDVRQTQAVWEQARKSALDKLNNQMITIITLQLKSGVSIPLRFVKRGHERFDW